MTKGFFKLFILFIASSVAISCSEQNIPELPDTPEGGGSTSQGFATVDQTQIKAKGGGFIIRVKTSGTWEASSSEAWCTLSRTSGSGNASITGYMKANTGAERSVVIKIKGENEKAEFTVKQLAGDGTIPEPEPEPEPDPDPVKPSGYAGRIEIPKLKGGEMNIFHTWTTKMNGKEIVTYSYEYDCTKKHVRWVALTFDNVTSQNNVDRKDAYKTDPNIPTKYQTEKKDYYSPYNRGHMVASSDRLYSQDANSQTFYYSNISPQLITGFNQGGSTWDAIENKVQEWAKVSNPKDTTYIVKGTSIDYSILETGKYGVQIPKYYYSTILSYKNGQYKAIGFYIEHKSDKSKNIKACAKSIDELEKLTGLDFYHNLPDKIENVVEANYNENDWSW